MKRFLTRLAIRLAVVAALVGGAMLIPTPRPEQGRSTHSPDGFRKNLFRGVLPQADVFAQQSVGPLGPVPASGGETFTGGTVPDATEFASAVTFLDTILLPGTVDEGDILTLAAGNNTADRTLTLTSGTNLTMTLDSGSFLFSRNLLLPSHSILADTIQLAPSDDATTGWQFRGSGSVVYYASNTATTFTDVDEVRHASGVGLRWSSTASSLGSPDTGLRRHAAGYVTFTDGSTGAGGFRLMEPAVSGTNYITFVAEALANDNLTVTYGQNTGSGDLIIAGTNVQWRGMNHYFRDSGTTDNAFAIIQDGSGIFKAASDLQLAWSATTDASAAADTGFARSAAAVVRATNSSTGLGYLIYGRTVTANTGTATPAIIASGTLYSNTGDADGSAITLPNDPTIGTQFMAYANVDQNIVISPSSGETLNFNGAACASFDLDDDGEAVTIVAITGGSGAYWGVLSNVGGTCTP